jgi:hypothetical protein
MGQEYKNGGFEFKTGVVATEKASSSTPQIIFYGATY